MQTYFAAFLYIKFRVLIIKTAVSAKLRTSCWRIIVIFVLRTQRMQFLLANHCDPGDMYTLYVVPPGESL
jgi:hypothetical protein